MVAEITDLSRNLMLSIDIVPIPTDEAVKEVEQRLLGVETNITNWQRKQNMNNNFSAVIPYDMEQQRKETKEFLDDLTTRDQRMMFAVLTLVHTADSKKQLDNDTEEILTIVRKRLCQMSVLKYQQLDGLKTALPFGVRKIDAFRTLTTESLAVFMPFRVQEVYDSHGIYYGNNVISKNMIIADRRRLMNGNSFILGVPGGGKSFTAKNEIVNLMLSGDADIIIIDPESEYGPLVRALGGSVINISANSPNHINAMDMSRDYGETDPIIEKSQFLQSLCEQIVAGHKFQKGQQSIIDRCTENVYRYYKHSNRLICYDILELGEQLRAIGMLVILDSILNRITQNRQAGKRTYIFIDEIYLLFMHEYSAQFLYKLWKRVRKYGAFCTGITQNVADLLQSYTARTMLSNSEFIVMLNQAATDRIELAKLLNISNEQLSYITNVDAGHGLLKVGSSLVPFENKFPKDTKLYALMTSKFGEGYFAGNANMPGDPSNIPRSNSDEQEILRKIREVAVSNADFDEMVRKYLNQAES